VISLASSVRSVCRDSSVSWVHPSEGEGMRGGEVGGRKGERKGNSGFQGESVTSEFDKTPR